MKVSRDFWDRLSFVRKTIICAMLGIVAGFILIQLIPYGRNHSNPPVLNEPSWDSAQTRDFAVRSCFACHSNEVEWPWYSNIAPTSWLVQRGVDKGREAFNYSEWSAADISNAEREEDHHASIVRERGMPLCDYLWVHPSARLSAAESQAFARGLEATNGFPITNSPVAETGKGLVKCVREDMVRTVVPQSLRTKGAIVSFGLGFIFGGFAFTALASSAYLIYRRRQVRTG